MSQATSNYELPLELARKSNLLALPFFLSVFSCGMISLMFSTSSCDRSLRYSINAVMIIPTAGAIFTPCKNSFFIWMRLGITLLVVVLHLVPVVFTYVALDGDVREYGHLSKDKVYRIEDYSRWLRRTVDTDSKWTKIRSCEGVGDNICFKRFRRYSHKQAGCCKPPSECGFVHRGGPVWDKPAAGSITSNNTDWDNDRGLFCYDCQSCKAAVLAITKDEWEYVAILNVIVLAVYGIVLFAIVASAYFAVRKNMSAMHIPDRMDNSLPIPIDVIRL